MAAARGNHRLQRKMDCMLGKLSLGMKANALMHGWQRLDDVGAGGG